MGEENPLWGEERIANELLLKLGVRISPRTVRKYLPKRPPGRPRGDQRWSTFLQNHARAVLACDFFVVVTATFRLLYVFVIIEHGSRRLMHVNVTAHPSAAWTLRQTREVIGDTDDHRFLIHVPLGLAADRVETSVARTTLHPARCQPIIVAGCTTTSALRQSNSLARTARLTRVAASTRRGRTPRSRNSANWRPSFEQLVHVRELAHFLSHRPFNAPAYPIGVGHLHQSRRGL